MRCTFTLLAIVAILLVTVPFVAAQDNECEVINSLDGIEINWCTDGILTVSFGSYSTSLRTIQYTPYAPTASAINQEAGVLVQFDDGYLQLEVDTDETSVAYTLTFVSQTNIVGVLNNGFSEFYCLLTMNEGEGGGLWGVLIDERGWTEGDNSCATVTLVMDQDTTERITRIITGH